MGALHPPQALAVSDGVRYATPAITGYLFTIY